MKVFDDKHIKNVVLLGSHGCGKTTLAETMLFEAGLIDRRGRVEDKNTVSDHHDLGTRSNWQKQRKFDQIYSNNQP